MPRVTHHYDLVVVGRDLAGLAAAALVARRGKRVLVVPGGPLVGRGRCIDRDVLLDPAPLPWIESPPVHAVLREVGLATQVGRRIRRRRGLQQLVRDRARFEWPANGSPPWPTPEPTEGAPPWHALANLALDERSGPFASRRSAERAGRLARTGSLPASDDALALLDAYAPFVTGLAGPALPTAVRAGLWANLLPSAVDLEGGEARLREDLIKMLELHGGEVRPDLRIEGFTLRRGRIDAVHFAGRTAAFGAEHVAVADVDLARSGLGDAPIVAPERAPDLARRFTMVVEVEPAGVGPGPGDHLVIEAPLFGTAQGASGACLLDVDRRHEDRVVLHVAALVAPGADLQRMREDVLAFLDAHAILPFVGEHVRWCASAHDGRPPTDGDGRPLPSVSNRPAPRPVAMVPVLAPADPLAGGVALAPTRTGVRNLYLCCSLNLPALGLSGSFAAAHLVAGIVAEPARSALSKRPLLRRT